MKKKKTIIITSIIILILVIIALLITFYLVDKSRIKQGEKPIFIRNLKHDGISGEKDDNEENNTFIGTVISSVGIFEEVYVEKNDGNVINILVEPDKNELIRKSTDKISIGLKQYDGNAYDPGTKVKITYTGEVMESYPSKIKCTNIEEIQNKNLEMYKMLIDDIIKQDTALNEEAKFIAIDFENFLAFREDKDSEQGGYYRALSKNEKKALLEYCKKYNENVKEANFNQLKEQGYFNEKTIYLDGILIKVNKIEKIIKNKAILRMEKYRSGNGAIYPKYELDLINEYYWNLKTLDMMISAKRDVLFCQNFANMKTIRTF